MLTDGRTDRHHQSMSRNCFAIRPKKEQYTICMNMYDKQVNYNNNKNTHGSGRVLCNGARWQSLWVSDVWLKLDGYRGQTTQPVSQK